MWLNVTERKLSRSSITTLTGILWPEASWLVTAFAQGGALTMSCPALRIDARKAPELGTVVLFCGVDIVQTPICPSLMSRVREQGICKRKDPAERIGGI